MNRPKAIQAMVCLVSVFAMALPITAHAEPTSPPAVTTSGSRATGRFVWTQAASDEVRYGAPPSGGTRARSAAVDPWAAYRARLATCGEPIDSWCMLWALELRPDVGTGGTSAPRPPTRTDAEAVAREVILTLKVAKPTPRIAPRTTERDGNMMVVGYPLWLWAEDGNTASTTETRYGLTFTLDARRDKTVFDMGDGFVVTCLATTPYEPTTAPGTPSPTCGHRYRKASLPRGTYTVTATSHWTVTWSGLGFSGTLPLTSSDSVHIPVGELQSVVTG